MRYRIFLGCFGWYRTFLRHMLPNKWRQDAKNWLWYRSIAGIAFFYTHIGEKNTHRENYKNFQYRRLKIVRYLRYYDTFLKRCSYINTFLGIVLVSYWYRILESTIPSFTRWRH